MKRHLVFIFVFVTLIVSNPVMAWTPNGEKATIDRLYNWQDNGVALFVTSLGHICYIPQNEDKMYSLVLSLFTSGMQASIHCHDTEENYGGLMAHRVHRVIGMRSN